MLKLRCKSFSSLFFGIIVGYQIPYLFQSLRSSPVCERNVNYIASTFEEKDSKNQYLNQNHGSIYIGLLSAEKFFNSRLESTVNTWLRHLPSNVKVEIFAENQGLLNSETNAKEMYFGNGVRIIQLPGVSDEEYPPQKKCFSMLKYMYDQHINKYDWFVRLDDDTYLDSQRLLRLLTGINASKPILIGHVGFGLHKEDFLGVNNTFCMGGTGIILSRHLLKLLVPHLKNCLGNLFTNHEDVELGRCIQKMTKVKCVTSWEAAERFFQDYDSKTGSIEAFSKINFETGVTFHPNKNPEQQKMFHVKLYEEKIKNCISKIARLEKEIWMYSGNHDHLMENSRADIMWKTQLDKSIYTTSERQKDRIHPLFVKIINQYEHKFKKIHMVKSISRKVNYRSVNPLFSADTISLMHVSHAYDKNRDREHFLLHRQYFPSSIIFIREPYGIEWNQGQSASIKLKSSINDDYFDPNDVKVNFIMILSGRIDYFSRFLSNFENVFLRKEENVNLIVVYFPTDRNNKQPVETQEKNSNIVLSNIQRLQQRYPDQSFKIVNMGNVTYCKTVGLQIAKDQVTNENEIMYFCDVDMMFNSYYFLRQIRYNTIQGKQAYYPVTFSQYNPAITSHGFSNISLLFDNKETDGFWRYYGYGMFSIYRSDFTKTKGFDTTICGWGQEDVEMVASVVKADLSIFQSPNPFQIHVFHDKFCDNSLPEPRLEACNAVKMLHYGPKSFLSQIYKKKYIV